MATDNRPPSYPLRLDTEIREKLEAVAKVNGRSLNAEISLRLGASLKFASANRVDEVRMDNSPSQESQAFLLPNFLLEREALETRQKFLEKAERSRQQHEKDLRDPVKQKKIEKKSNIFAAKHDLFVEQRKLDRLLSETEYEHLVREAAGALALRRIEQMAGADDFKSNPSTKGLSKSLMSAADLGPVVEDIALRVVCILFHDVIQKMIPDLIQKELAKAGIKSVEEPK